MIVFCQDTWAWVNEANKTEDHTNADREHNPFTLVKSFNLNKDERDAHRHALWCLEVDILWAAIILHCKPSFSSYQKHVPGFQIHGCLNTTHGRQYCRDSLLVAEGSGDMITKIGYKGALDRVQGKVAGILIQRTW